MDKRDMKILLVDDMAYMRMQIKHILSKAGYIQFSEAADGIAAITACRDFRPDLIILDIHLPKINGLDLIGFFISINPEVKILICSIEHRDEVYQRAIQLGAMDFIEKPVREKALLEKLAFVMDKKSTASTRHIGKHIGGVHDFSEKVGIKLDHARALQVLSLYGILDEKSVNDLYDTIVSLQAYNYRNVFLNLNGVTEFRAGYGKLKELSGLASSGNGLFMIICMNKEIQENVARLGMGDVIVKTELQAVRKLA